MAWDDRACLRNVADATCPERCAACDDIVAAGALFCAPCDGDVHRLDAPECEVCGAPRPAVDRCRPCRTAPSPIRAARAFAAYHHPKGKSPVARAIAVFKYGGGQRLGRRLAAALVARVPHVDVALVVPVPLHRRRLRQRGFNQSAVLARHLGRHLGRPCAPTVVVRTRDTPSQTALTPIERAINVSGAFHVARPGAVLGRAVLVVDDVWTSGATVRAVATALRTAGAAAVDVVTIARVL